MEAAMTFSRIRVVIVAFALLVMPSICRAQPYAGIGAGVGGASVSAGSYAAGFRGALRLYGGYYVTPHLAAEVMTIDLGTPEGRTTVEHENTIGGIAVAAVGRWPVQRWDFTGRVGVVSMEGRGTTTVRSAQPLVVVGAAFRVIRRLAIGIETATSRARMGLPVDDTVRVNWTTAVATFRF
jgi:hypothetical protein